MDALRELHIGGTMAVKVAINGFGRKGRLVLAAKEEQGV
jgi:hypothetical protein